MCTAVISKIKKKIKTLSNFAHLWVKVLYNIQSTASSLGFLKGRKAGNKFNQPINKPTSVICQVCYVLSHFSEKIQQDPFWWLTLPCNLGVMEIHIISCHYTVWFMLNLELFILILFYATYLVFMMQRNWFFFFNYVTGRGANFILMVEHMFRTRPL